MTLCYYAECHCAESELHFIYCYAECHYAKRFGATVVAVPLVIGLVHKLFPIFLNRSSSL